MNKSVFYIFLLCISYGFSQANNAPIASDIYASTLKEKNTLVHLVGNDKDVNDVLTYSIVSVSGHGVLTDPLNSAVLSIGSTLSNNGNSVNFVPNKVKFISYVDKGTSSFSYKVNDGTADSAVKTVEIKVYEDFLDNPSSVGLVVKGENAGDNLGFSVALSDKGDIMAVGSPKFGAATKGRVKVLKYNLATNFWDDLGNSIEGLNDGDRFGDSVSLNSSGTVLAVGSSYANNASRPIGQVRIFSYNTVTSVWDVIGTIEGSDVSSPKSESQQFGNDVRLSSDGKTLAISDIEYNGGFGRVVTYRYDGTNWNNIGLSTPIIGASGDKGGWSVDLSSNGNILAVGFLYNNTSAGSDAGQVKIFEYDGASDKWNNKGVLYPSNQIANERFGASLDLSSDGLIIAVGSCYDKPNNLAGEGSVGVYNWDSGTTWTQMGSELKDEVQDGNKAQLNYFGGYVSLNNSGNILGVHAPGYQFDGGVQQKKGLLRLYSYDVDSASWVKIKGDNFKILGEADGDYSANSNDESKGQKVFLSGDGSFVALGAELNDSNGDDSGHVRVFKLFDTQEIPVANKDEKTVAEKTELEITLSATDTDSGPDALKYFITELDSDSGSLFIAGNWIGKSNLPRELNGNTLKYISNSETNVSDNFKFIAHDGKASSAPVSVKLNITLVNDAPVAVDDVATIEEDADLININIIANDTDVDNTNAELTLTTYGYAGTGTVSINADNKSVNYKPALNFNGSETITYTVSDIEPLSDVNGTLTVTVNPVNDSPVAVNDVYAVVKNSGSNSIDVIANDTDVDRDALKLLSSLTYTGTGTATANADEKSVDYTPATDFTGTEVITYTVSDGTDTDATGTLTITVLDNDPPIAKDQSLTIPVDNPITITLEATDTENDPLTYVVNSLPAGGVLKEGANAIVAADLPRVLTGNTLTYETTTGGDVSFDFIVQQNSLATFAGNNNLDFVVSGGNPVTFIKPEGKTYYLVQKNATRMDWPTAKALADTFEGAQMFIPLNETMDLAIYNALIGMGRLNPNVTNSPFWYGLFQDKNAADWDDSLEADGGWVWTDGVKLGSAQRPYKNWHPDEPNNGDKKEDHAQFGRFTNTVKWNDMKPGANDSFPLFEFSVNSADDSNTATISIKVTIPNDPPIAKDQSLVIPVDTPKIITLEATDTENDPLTYVVNSLPAGGVLKEGANAIVAADLPRVLTGNTLSYESNSGGDFSFDFIVQQNSLATFAKANSLKFIENNGTPVTYQKAKGKTYFLIQENTGVSGFKPIDWTDARDLTNSIEGATMYIVLNADMEKKVWDGLRFMGLDRDGGNAIFFWLGLFHDNTSAEYAEPGNEAQNWGGWTWTNGVTLNDAGYQNWWGQASGTEPNDFPSKFSNDGDEDYGQFAFSSSGDLGSMWNDMSLGSNAAKSWPLFEFAVNSADDSNTATVSIKVEVTLPLADSQTLFFNEGSINNPIVLTGSDPKSQPLTYIITSKPDKGTLKVGGVALGALPATVNPNDLTYTPENLDYYGDQKFNFKVNNGTDDSLLATVNIIITNVNDAPESDPGNYTTEEELPVEIIHIGRDKDVLDIFTIHSQMGNDIPQPANITLGESSAISSNGKRLVLGAYNFPGSENSFARVYNWNGTDWDQLGGTLNGDTQLDNFGEYVSISSDGNRVAIAGSRNATNGINAGHVKVFDWDGTSWNAVGSPILGDNANDLFGFRGVHLSGDGNSIAIPSFSAGYIYVYDWDGKVWKKRAGSFSISPEPITPDNQFPGQVYLSMNGNRIVFGSMNEGARGQVRIYDWNSGNNSWTLYAQMDGTTGRFGNTVELTRDGKHLAIGEYDTSSVSVYNISGINPVKIGADITDDTQTSYWRYISLSDDGKRLGIPNLSKNKISIYDWNGTAWNQLGEDISGTGSWGESFDMSSDGTIFTSSGHGLPNRVFNILNLKYIVTTLPANGTLTEGAKTISAVPYTLTTLDQKLIYTPNNNFSGTDSYKFKLNDGIEDSTDRDSGIREDSTVTITINDFVLALPDNYTITTTETCAGSDFGIIEVLAKENTYQKNKPSGRVIPLNYNVKITGPNGFDQTRTITSPSKKLDTPLENLEKGSYKLIFTVPLAINPVGGGESPPYTFEQDVVVIETVAPIAHPVTDIEICDDNVDGDDTNGKANFVIDTPTLITSLLTDPNTAVVQDVNLFDFEFEYLDDTTSKKEKTAVLPNPLYSANQTILVTMTSKANGKCIANQSINLVVNLLPVFDRIEDTKSVCTNLPPVTIGVESTDSRVYTYTWTRNGIVFPFTIPGIDSSISIGTGGEYIVTATTTDGTNCSQSMTIQMKESSIATITEKDITRVIDLKSGPNNSITISTATLGIGDYEFAIDDVTGPYQDETLFENLRPGKHTIYVRDKNDCGIANLDFWIIGFKKFFTPNGDGFTDNWNVVGVTANHQSKTKIYIFDRFGKLLKELDPLSKGWDGTFNGNPMPQTDYWFKIVLEDGRVFKGHFSLLRGW